MKGIVSTLVAALLLPQVSPNLAMTRERHSANGFAPPPYAGTWNSQNQATLDFASNGRVP